MTDAEPDGAAFMLLDRSRQLGGVTWQKVSEDEDTWHVLFFVMKGREGLEREESNPARVAEVLRYLAAHARDDPRWQVIASFAFPETIRSVIPLPVPVEDEWATDIRGMRFVKKEGENELYSVIVDRPARELTHQVGFRKREPLRAASVRRWMSEARRISDLFVVRGGERDAGD